ncbi:MAG: T9SS type A sorting domain-containing protein [bacterium]|nr:T9SS type A sorting domain-containing protein [bacterium]
MQRLFKLGFAVLIVLMVTTSTQAVQRTVYADGSGPFPTIQAALAVSAFQDSILLGDGVFRGPGNRDLVMYDQTILSLSDDPELCRIDAEGFSMGRIGETPQTHIARFQGIEFYNTAGWENGTGNYNQFTNCRFVDCSHIMGVFGYIGPNAQIIMEQCLITGCEGERLLYADFLVLDDCEFVNNVGTVAAGIRVDITDCRFIQNRAERLITANNHMEPLGRAWIVGCELYGNQVEILIGSGFCPVKMDDCLIRDNSGSMLASIDNHIEADAPYQIRSCSFVGNYGAEGADIDVWGGDDEHTFENCIFAHRREGNILNIPSTDMPSMVFTDCNLYGNVSGDWVEEIADQFGIGCNVSVNPLFCDWWAGDLTVSSESYCLPENNPCGVLIGALGEGCETLTIVPEGAPAAVMDLSAYPNPFNPKTSIRFTTKTGGLVKLSVYDAAGRHLAMLLDEVVAAGEHVVDWTARNAEGNELPSGVYFVNMESGGEQVTRKLTLLR